MYSIIKQDHPGHCQNKHQYAMKDTDKAYLHSKKSSVVGLGGGLELYCLAREEDGLPVAANAGVPGGRGEWPLHPGGRVSRWGCIPHSLHPRNWTR